LKPDFHLIGSRVETGRFQATESTGFANLYSPAEMRNHRMNRLKKSEKGMTPLERAVAKAEL
jgi:hypothetical protein